MTVREPDIESQQQGDEDARDDNVPESQHGKIAGIPSIL